MDLKNIERSGTAKHGRVARRSTPERMARRIVREVRFGLDDPNDPFPVASADAQLLTEERSSHDLRGTVVKTDGKRSPPHGSQDAAAIAKGFSIDGDRRLSDNDPGKEGASVGPSVERITTKSEGHRARFVVLGLGDGRREMGIHPDRKEGDDLTPARRAAEFRFEGIRAISVPVPAIGGPPWTSH